MARMTHESAKEYESNGFDSFSLADDGDSARVQFMIDNIDDVLAFSTHEIPMLSQSGKEYQRKVSCLKMHKDDPEGVCPLCDASTKVKIARFIPMYDLSKNKAVLWERGARFIDNTLGGFFNRMRRDNVDIKNLVVEIVRQGRKGDNQTTYAIYPMERLEPVDISNVEIPDPEGSLVAVWTKSDMSNYVNNGTVPQTNNTSNDVNEGVQRRTTTPQNSSTAPASTIPKDDYEAAETVDDPEDFF